MSARMVTFQKNFKFFAHNDAFSNTSFRDELSSGTDSVCNLGDNVNCVFSIYCWTKYEIEQTLNELPSADIIFKQINDDKENINDIERNAGNTTLFAALYHKLYGKLNQQLGSGGSNVNARDSRGRSLLHLACFFGDIKSATLLIHHGAEINCWNDNEEVMPLHCAAFVGSTACVQLLLENKAKIINEKGMRRTALYYAVQRNAIDCVKLLLAHKASPDAMQAYAINPLHVAANGGFYECMHLLLQNGAKIGINTFCHYENKNYTALHLCALGNFAECAKLLLDNGAIVDSLSNDNETPLHIACLEQSSETAAMLIKYGANVKLTYDNGRTALHAAITKQSKFWDCAQLLLDAKVDVNQADDFGYTALHTAALNDLGDCVLLLINHGADVTAETKGHVTALSIITRRTPDVIPKYIEKFDACISINGDYEIGDQDLELRLDFRLLIPHSNISEMNLLMAFLDAGQKRILKHPLCAAFLFLKWVRIRKFFLFSLGYHALFVMLFSVYVLSLFCSLDNIDNTPFDTWVAKHIASIAILITLMNSCLCGKEIFQMSHGVKGYLLYWENWLQWLTICGVYLTCAFTFMNHNNVQIKEPPYQYHIGAIVIFLVWLELMMIIGRFPMFGLYVQMFTTVSVDFLKFLGAYCCLIMAFSLSFRVLFTYHKTFLSIFRSFMKALFMMAGEFNYEDIFYNNGTVIEHNSTMTEDIIPYPITSHIMFISFIFLVTIILTNLLVGLAVSDIQSLQASAALDRLTRQAKLVAQLESVMYSQILQYLCPQFQLLFRKWSTFSKTFLIIKPNKQTKKELLSNEIMVSLRKFVCSRKEDSENRKSRYSVKVTNNKAKARISKARYQLPSSIDQTISTNLDDKLTEVLQKLELYHQETQDKLNEMTKLIKCDDYDIE